MSGKPEPSGSGKGNSYSLRAAKKKDDYLSDTSESEEYQSSTSSDTDMEEVPMVLPTDSDEEPPNEFLRKRAQNIENNKAMLAKLMADLEKLPRHLNRMPPMENENFKHQIHSPAADVLPRRNPERASRVRMVRAYTVELPSSPENEAGAAGPKVLPFKQRLVGAKVRETRAFIISLPHVVRPVEEITEEELNNIAADMKSKVQNVDGSACHHCRQKTLDTKTNCRNVDCRGIRGQYCGPCLKRMYDEDARTALLDPQWNCPPCRGICHCGDCHPLPAIPATRTYSVDNTNVFRYRFSKDKNDEENDDSDED